MVNRDRMNNPTPERAHSPRRTRKPSRRNGPGKEGERQSATCSRVIASATKSLASLNFSASSPLVREAARFVHLWAESDTSEASKARRHGLGPSFLAFPKPS